LKWRGKKKKAVLIPGAAFRVCSRAKAVFLHVHRRVGKKCRKTGSWIDDIVDPGGFPEFCSACFDPPFHIVSGNLQQAFPPFALTAPILQGKPSSPFNSTDLPWSNFHCLISRSPALFTLGDARLNSSQVPCGRRGQHGRSSLGHYLFGHQKSNKSRYRIQPAALVS
jgi:hypothetical protein